MRTGKLGLTDLISFSVRLQFWLGGREHPLEDSIESPPTAGRKDFVLQRKIWFTASYKFAERKLA